MLAAFTAGDGAQKPEIGRRKCVGLAQLPERNVLRSPFTDPADGAKPLHCIIKPAIGVEHMRIGDGRGCDRRQRRSAASRHAERSEFGCCDNLRPREDMRQRTARRWQRLTMGRHHAAAEARSGHDSDLLAEHRADRQFETVPGTRYAQAWARLHQRRQSRILGKVRGDGQRIGAEIEHAAQPRDDGRQCRQFRKPHARAQRVAGRRLDRDGSGQPAQLQRARIVPCLDMLDAGDRALPQKRDHCVPVVRRLIAQQQHKLSGGRSRKFRADGTAQFARRTIKQLPKDFVEAANAAEARGEGDFGHRQLRLVNELFGEQHPPRLRDRNRRGAEMLADRRRSCRSPRPRRPASASTSASSSAPCSIRLKPRDTVFEVPRQAPRSGAVSGRQRKQGRKPASCAAAAVGKKMTFFDSGVRAGQTGRQ
jgi:hypothetical protein